jgi:hypothetical protein
MAYKVRAGVASTFESSGERLQPVSNAMSSFFVGKGKQCPTYDADSNFLTNWSIRMRPKSSDSGLDYGHAQMLNRYAKIERSENYFQGLLSGDNLKAWKTPPKPEVIRDGTHGTTYTYQPNRTLFGQFYDLYPGYFHPSNGSIFNATSHNLTERSIGR